MQSFIIKVSRFYIQVIADDRDRIVRLRFSKTVLPVSGGLSANVRLLQEELILYFSSYPVHRWSTQIVLYGSPFEKAVWERIRRIPYGRIRTYKQIAQSMGNIHLARAVGNACRKNPVPIIIPCHRVVRSSGEPGGYSQGDELKRYLLQLEGFTPTKHMIE